MNVVVKQIKQIEGRHRHYRIKISRWSLTIFASILFVSSLFIVHTIAQDLHQPSQGQNSIMLTLANQERISRGLVPLQSDPALEKAAQAKAQDMFKNQYFDHISPTGRTPWQFITESGYEYEYAGENLAIDFSSHQATHRAWMASPTHRDNIIDSNYREVGIVSVVGQFQGRQTTITVQMFGSTSSTSIIQKAASVLK